MPPVHLRKLVAADSAEFVALARASLGFHRPWLNLPTTPEGFAAYLARFDQVRAVAFVICVADTGAMAGMASISQIVRGSYQRGVLGFGAFAGYAGFGYMSEGLPLVVRHAFASLGLHRLEADIQPGNRAAIGLVGRLGFRREGLYPWFIQIDGNWRGHERWVGTAETIS